jgi:hypothetical protein
MSPWYFATLFILGSTGLAMAQSGNAVGSGVTANSNSLTGPNIDTANGINANGTPRSQSPGASMTVGAGNSTMIPGVAGGPPMPPAILGVPPAGTATPTINGAPASP